MKRSILRSNSFIAGVLALNLFASTSKAATWHAILFGGVDSTPSENMFQKDFAALGGALQSNGWDVQVLFGNQYSCSQCSSSWSVDPIAAALAQSPSQIGRASKVELMKRLDALTPSLQAGDQLLIAINTHGIADFKFGSATVKLSAFDEMDPNGARANQMAADGHQLGTMVINDPALVSRFQALKAKGVKLAFGNDACFSGPTAKVLSQYGCVVTQTSQSKYGLGSPVYHALLELLNANTKDLLPVLVNQDGRITMEDEFLGVTPYATYGINSPYYTTPFAGVLEPQFSAFLNEYDAVEKLAGAWLLKLPATELALQNNQLVKTGSASDFSILQDFVQTYLSPFLNPSEDKLFQATAAYYVKNKFTPYGNFAVDSPSELVNHIVNAESELQDAQNTFQALGNQEKQIQLNLSSLGVDLAWTLPAPYVDGQPAFERALQTLDGKNLSLTYLSASNSPTSAWISTQMSTAPFPKGQRLFSPSDVWFSVNTKNAATLIATEMAKTYPEAQSQAFQAALANRIAQGESQAWNSMSNSAQTVLQQVNQLVEISGQKSALIHQGNSTRFIQYAVEARIYAYLFHHVQSGQNDPDVNHCRDFTLKNL